jgi:formylmethanofuran dehydrogenase subunit A
MKKRKSKTSSKVGVKANGTLKKGYRYAKGGKVVKAKAKK